MLLVILNRLIYNNKCCGAIPCDSTGAVLNCNSASDPSVQRRVVDPDPDWIRIQWGLWIRIRNPDSDPGVKK
jgi:hypothetical protein